MNRKVTSKEELLNICRQLVQEKGITSVNMRSVAKQCGVSLGVLYHYFPSKEALLTETIGSVWKDIFHMDECEKEYQDFPSTVIKIYEQMRKGTEDYPNFFTAHSMSFAQYEVSDAKHTMDQYQKHIHAGLKNALENDPHYRKDVFNASFKENAFLDFILNTMISSLLSKESNCNVLVEMIRRTIY